MPLPRKPLRRYLLSVAIGLALGLAGCGFKSYSPKPLKPQETAAELAARSLADPGLRAYLRSRGVAVDPWRRSSWTLAELTWVAFYFGPELDIARAQIAVAKAGETTAAMRPNPFIQLRSEHHSLRFPEQSSPWTWLALFDFPIVTGGKREARIAHAEALSEAALIDLGSRAWKTRSDLRVRYVDVYAATLAERVSVAELGLREEEEALITRRLDKGFASQADVSAARGAAAAARLRAQQSVTRLREARAALAPVLGLPLAEVEPLVLPFADLSDSRALGSADDQRAAALENRLDIRRALADYAAAEAVLRYEIGRQYPDLILRPGYVWDQGDKIWVLGVISALPIFNRNEGPIAEAEARRELEAERFRALQARAIGEVEVRFRGVAGAQAELTAAERFERDAQDRKARIERRFAAGDADRLERTQARLEALSALRAAQGAQVHLLQASGTLEDAIQMPLGGGTSFQPEEVSPRLTDALR